MDSVNTITKSMLHEVKYGQTALVISKDCNETMVIVNNPQKAYGANVLVTDGSNNIEDICSLCIRTGLPKNFVYLNADYTGEVYISMECAKDTLPIAICIKEIADDTGYHLKLCKVLVEDYKKENKSENEFTN